MPRIEYFIPRARQNQIELLSNWLQITNLTFIKEAFSRTNSLKNLFQSEKQINKKCINEIKNEENHERRLEAKL